VIICEPNFAPRRERLGTIVREEIQAQGKTVPGKIGGGLSSKMHIGKERK
jgi:hypothetical protein